MSEQPPDPDGRRQLSSLTDLEARIKRAREAQQPEESRGRVSGSLTGFGLAMRVGIELVAGVAVGVGFGVVLDYWWGTSPWMLILFFFLGAAAGALNVYRAVSRLAEDGDRS